MSDRSSRVADTTRRRAPERGLPSVAAAAPTPRRARGGARTRTVGFEPRHVPQLLPDDLYGARLRAPWSRFPEEVGRTYSALGLARLAGAADWHEAAAAIGLDAARVEPILAKARLALADPLAARRYRAELRAVAERYACEGLVDYAARRRRFADLLIPEADWETIRAEAGIPRRRGDSRRRNASAWLWAELTGGPWQQAPVFGGRATETPRKLYARFVDDLLPALRGPLLAYGETLVAPRVTERPPLRLVL
jgi:hypothetical protein